MRLTLPMVIVLFTVAADAQLNTWIQQPSGTSTWLHSVYFVSTGIGWAVGDGGTILKSTNTGISWSQQTSGKTLTLTSVDFIDANNGLVSGGKGFAGVVLKTTNGGTNWNVVDTSTNLSSVDYVTASLAWAVGAGGIIKSTNGGSTWLRQPLPDSSTSYNSIKFFDPDTGWLTGLSPSSGVLYKTTNGGATWMSETTGIHYYDYIDAISFLDAQYGWMSGYTVPDTIGYGMIKRTTDGGISWSDMPLGTDQELYSIAFASLNEGWTCGSSGIILHTTDGGTNWFEDGSIATSLDRIVVRPGEGGWMVGLDGTILRNNLGGLSQQISIAMSTGWNMVSLPLDILDRRKTSLYPTATSNVFRYVPSQGYVSDDTLDLGTGYWVKFNGAPTIEYNGSQVDSVSLNLTAGWNLVGSISTDVPVSQIMQSPSNSITNVYGYASTGYHADTLIQTGRAYWIKVSQNCTLTITSMLHGSVSKNMYTDISKFNNNEVPPPPPGDVLTEDSPKGQPLPTEYRLGQNYPNPFNPTTVIQFDIPEVSVVKLVVFNLLGQQAANVVDGVVQKGTQHVTWNISDNKNQTSSSEIYFYRIDVQSLESKRHFSEIRKMVFIK